MVTDRRRAERRRPASRLGQDEQPRGDVDRPGVDGREQDVGGARGKIAEAQRLRAQQADAHLDPRLRGQLQQIAHAQALVTRLAGVEQHQFDLVAQGRRGRALRELHPGAAHRRELVVPRIVGDQSHAHVTQAGSVGHGDHPRVHAQTPLGVEAAVDGVDHHVPAGARLGLADARLLGDQPIRRGRRGGEYRQHGILGRFVEPHRDIAAGPPPERRAPRRGAGQRLARPPFPRRPCPACSAATRPHPDRASRENPTGTVVGSTDMLVLPFFGSQWQYSSRSTSATHQGRLKPIAAPDRWYAASHSARDRLCRPTTLVTWLLEVCR